MKRNNNPKNLAQNRIDYIVFHNTDAANNLLFDYGFEKIESKQHLSQAIKELVKNKGRKVIKDLLAIHPDKVAILQVTKSEDALCATSPTFNKWLLKNELDISNMATRSIADISEIGGNIFGLGKSLTKILSIGVPVILTITLILIVVVLRNSAKDADITDLAMLTPAGRATKLLGK